MGSGARQSRTSIGRAETDQRRFVGRHRLEDPRRRIDPGRRPRPKSKTTTLLSCRPTRPPDRPAAGSPLRSKSAGQGPGPGGQRQFRPLRAAGRGVCRWPIRGRLGPGFAGTASADHEQRIFPVAAAIDNNPAPAGRFRRRWARTTWRSSSSGRRWKSRRHDCCRSRWSRITARRTPSANCGWPRPGAPSRCA